MDALNYKKIFKKVLYPTSSTIKNSNCFRCKNKGDFQNLVTHIYNMIKQHCNLLIINQLTNNFIHNQLRAINYDLHFCTRQTNSL